MAAVHYIHHYAGPGGDEPVTAYNWSGMESWTEDPKRVTCKKCLHWLDHGCSINKCDKCRPNRKRKPRPEPKAIRMYALVDPESGIPHVMFERKTDLIGYSYTAYGIGSPRIEEYEVTLT